MILVIDNYDSFTWNLVQLLEVAGADVVVRRNDEIDAAGFDRLGPSGLLISPGPSHPDAIPGVASVVRHALGLADDGAAVAAPRCPVLGVCLGHQLLGRVFGADVQRAPAVVHGHASRMVHEGDGVLADIVSPTAVGRYHSLAVVESTLPSDVIVTGRSEDGVVMAMRHARLPAEGVQFHPESILTPDGAAMLTTFVQRCLAARTADRQPGGAARGAMQ